MSVDVACLGETMALVAPDPPLPLATATRFVLGHAGAESNVAVSLARLGSRASWCSRLGDDALGRRILAEISAAGVDTAAVQLNTAARTGVLFKDPRAGATDVVYYRGGSAASAMDETDVDRALASKPKMLHLSGITPGLSPSCARAVDYTLERARRDGVLVSFDVNYRAALWPERDSAARALARIAGRCDIVFVGLDEAVDLWGVTTADSVRALLEQPGVLVVKDGARSASSYEDGRCSRVDALEVDVLEPVGAGDAFAAGWLHGRLAGMSAVEALRLGHLVAAGSLSSVTDHSLDSLPPATLRGLARDDSPWPPTDWPAPSAQSLRPSNDRSTDDLD